MGLGASIHGTIQLNSSLEAGEQSRFQNPRVVQSLLRNSKVIAIVGLSTEKTKASNMVASYLLDEGYQVVPIHPKAESILGQPSYKSLRDVPFPIDIVDAFRPSEEVSAIAEDAIAIGARALWTQLKIVNIEAGDRALAAGLEVVQDRCIKIEHGRYAGALHFFGINTEVVSAKRLR